MQTKKVLGKILLTVIALTTVTAQAQTFHLNDAGYFNAGGTDVMAFSDFYPEGHQGGVCVIMNGLRIATNGDIRLEATPGQWQPVPKQLSRKAEGNRITTTLCYPDSSRHLTGFNPMVYPDWRVNYTVTVEPQGKGILVTVDLDTPVPDYLLGKVGFNLEFYPGYLFGKPWLMDQQSGIYPQQPNAPLLQMATNRDRDGNFFAGRGLKADLAQLDGVRSRVGTLGGMDYSPLRADDIIAEPYAVGTKFTSRPDDKRQKLTVESLTGMLKLYDGRMNHNNGWFVLRSEIAKGATKGAVRWMITPEVDNQWRYQPVIQTSQIGYQTKQQKRIVIETDKRDNTIEPLQVVRIDADGETVVRTIEPKVWGNFLRYRYLTVDLSDITESGLYQLRYANAQSSVFRISDNVYERGVWQPVIEYFLPVQMCHMRVSEKYRIWHDACHMDDALMAKVGNHIDGYVQQPGLSKYAEGAKVPGVNVGGWHDAGDFDLRVESQAGEAYILALAYEQFHPNIDVTAIDQQRHRVEIHEPDGKNDILQQVENGALTVVRSYQALGRLYRGIICNSLRQYAMLGDAAAMTDGVAGNSDDRWIFTEDNPMRALSTAAQLSGAARVLRGFNDALSKECIDIAQKLYNDTEVRGFMMGAKLQVAVELYLTTNIQEYLDFILSQQQHITSNIARYGWFMARIAKLLESKKDKRSRQFVAAFRTALVGYKSQLDKQSAETPYGVPYRPSIWGAGWDIQRFGFEYYFLASAYPDIFSKSTIYSALDFVLGCHPGSNTASFASGVGARSATVAYGLNRADWSYIPGGVVSGTALIRPDFPELLEFPFLWQQTEYVLGGGSSHYMFLVLAAIHKTACVHGPSNDIVAEGEKPVRVSDSYSFTEGPAADAKGDVYFTDQPNNRIYRWDCELGKISLFTDQSGRSNGMYFDAQGNLIACADMDNQLWSFDKDGHPSILITDFGGRLLNGPNDVWISKYGGYYLTDPYFQRDYWTRNPERQQPVEGLYYLAPGGKQLTMLDSTLNQPNGIVGTPDGKHLYVAEAKANRILKYDIQPDGSLTNRQVFATMGSDGMTIDDRGNIYLTGDGVTVFDKDGYKIAHFPIPEDWTANVCFGGKERNILFITASKSVYTLKMLVHGVK